MMMETRVTAIRTIRGTGARIRLPSARKVIVMSVLFTSSGASEYGAIYRGFTGILGGFR